MKVDIQYLIIYSLDVCKDNQLTISNCKPEIVCYPKFRVTETKVEDKEYYKQHRKYVGIVSPKELVEFLVQIEAIETCQTMGSLTLEFGMLPAICFSTEHNFYGFDDSAYISPMFSPETNCKLFEQLDKMPTNQKQAIIENEVSPLFDILLNALENCLTNPDAEKQLVANYEVAIDQLQLVGE